MLRFRTKIAQTDRQTDRYVCPFGVPIFIFLNIQRAVNPGSDQGFTLRGFCLLQTVTVSAVRTEKQWRR